MSCNSYFADLFDAVHQLFEDVASNIGYCSSYGHVHDPYNDLVKHNKVLKENDYYCRRCDKRYDVEDVEKAKRLWWFIKDHFEGFEPLLYSSDYDSYRVYLSASKCNSRIELEAKKSDEWRDEGFPGCIILEDAEDLERLPQAYDLGESDEGGENQR